jgi:diguanylate cyclase (GGDEF)-like protein
VAWEQGLVPDIVSDTEDLTSRMKRVHTQLKALASEDLATKSPEDLLSIAMRMEFYMLDPVFGELIELTEPGHARTRHDVYDEHLQRLIGSVARYSPPDSLAVFLASILARTWRDNVALATYATHDTLTGILNRRALTTYLPQWTAWSARYGRPLAVLLIDVDRFKQINDTSGHATGDRALAAVATAIRGAVRTADLVARFGGDEFVVIAPETDETAYFSLSARILEAVAALEVRSDSGEAVEVTVSIGGSVTTGAAETEPVEVDVLLAAADQSLYAAKRGGRRRAAAPGALTTA